MKDEWGNIIESCFIKDNSKPWDYYIPDYILEYSKKDIKKYMKSKEYKERKKEMQQNERVMSHIKIY